MSNSLFTIFPFEDTNPLYLQNPTTFYLKIKKGGLSL